MSVKKIIFLVLVILLISFVFIPKTFAFADIIEDGNDFLDSGESEEEVINETKLKKVSSKIYNILLVCGIGAAVIVGAVLGITFILSSAEGKAKVSETLVPYIIGCVVVFGAFTIWKLTINIGNNVSNVGGYKSAEAVNEAAQKIIDGELDPNTLSDEKIADLYQSQWVGDDLRAKTTADPRGGPDQKILTLPEAIKDLSKYKRKIYNAAKNRGLLAENGIDLKK